MNLAVRVVRQFKKYKLHIQVKADHPKGDKPEPSMQIKIIFLINYSYVHQIKNYPRLECAHVNQYYPYSYLAID